MNISENNQTKSSSTEGDISNGRKSLYDSIVSINPALKQVFDFKTILFSDSTNKYTPDECQQIYNGEKKIKLLSDEQNIRLNQYILHLKQQNQNLVKFVDGKLEIRRNQSQVQDTLMRLKLMNVQARLKQEKKGQNNNEDYEYNYEDDDYDDEDYEDIYDEEGMDDLYGDDEYDEYDDDQYDDEEYQIDQQEDRLYKYMLRDMQESMEKDMYNEFSSDIHETQNRPNKFISSKKANQNLLTEPKEQIKNNKNSNKKQDDDEEWCTESDEWEDDDEDEDYEDEDEDDESNSQKGKNNKNVDKNKSKKSQKNNKFSSIKVCEEDYQD